MPTSQESPPNLEHGTPAWNREYRMGIPVQRGRPAPRRQGRGTKGRDSRLQLSFRAAFASLTAFFPTHSPVGLFAKNPFWQWGKHRRCVGETLPLRGNRGGSEVLWQQRGGAARKHTHDGHAAALALASPIRSALPHSPIVQVSCPHPTLCTKKTI